ncbi:MAG: PAS domain S-box protein [Geothrix sp.]|nr:PAS domain S-box protein [Geothrix sp.]
MEAPLRRAGKGLFLALFLLVALLLSVAGGAYLRSRISMARHEAQKNLEAVATLKVAQIEEWYQLRHAVAAQVLRSEFHQRGLHRLLTHPQDEQARRELTAWMDGQVAVHGYQRMGLFDARGRPILMVPLGSLCEAPPPDRFQPALREREVTVLDLHRHAEHTEAHLSFSIPVSGPGGGSGQGLLVFQMDAAHRLFALIQTWPTPSGTAETLLVRREGDRVRYLNRLRHRPDGTPDLALDGQGDGPAMRAVQEEGGFMAGRDYRGEPVLAAYRKIPGTPWSMVSKVDESEIYGPVREQVWVMGTLLFGLLVAAALAVRALLRQRELVGQQARLVLEQDKARLAARFEQLMHQANDTILLWDDQGRLVDANAQAEAYYGYSQEELRGKRLEDLRAPAALAELPAHWREAQEQGRQTFETLHRRKDGSVFPVEVSARRVELEGEFFVLSLVRDITERRAQEAQLQRMNRLYAALSQVNQGVVWSRDEADLLARIPRVLVDFGGFALAWIGRPDPETRIVQVLGRAGQAADLLDRVVVRSDETPGGLGLVGRALRTGHPCLMEDARGTPDALPWQEELDQAGLTSMAAFPLHRGGGIWGVLAVYARETGYFGDQEMALLAEAAMDVSFALDHLDGEAQRARAVEALRIHEGMLLRAERMGSFGHWSLDLATGAMEVSEGARAIYGLGSGAVTYEAAKQVPLPEERPGLDQAMKALREEGQPYDVTFRIRRASDGGPREIRSMAEYDPLSQRVFGTIQDVTQARAMERRLQEADKMESLGHLAAGVAHDMNNVLAAILGLVSLHQDQLPETHPMHKALGTMERACLRGRDLLLGLLGFARRELEKEGPVDMNGLIQETAALLARTTLQRVRLDLDLQPDLGILQGDAGALGRVLINLCVNAVDAMPKGGSLTLCTRRIPGGGLEVVVRDTGEGMSPEVAHRALEPFFTTKPHGQGTGLGLSMAYGVLKAHGGDLEIHSRLGEGTEIRLGFPSARMSQGTVPAAPAAPHRDTPLRALRVLVVDDDELVRESVVPMLELLGHRVEAVPSGAEALRCLELGCEVDLIVLDMNMPGLTGAETLPRILALRPGLPVIMASGRRDESLANLIAPHPQVSSLAKPFSLRDLAAQIQALEAFLPRP